MNLIHVCFCFDNIARLNFRDYLRMSLLSMFIFVGFSNLNDFPPLCEVDAAPLA